MVSLCRETEPDWDKDLRDEVLEECSKQGSVLHILVDRESTVGAESVCGRASAMLPR